MVRCQNPARAGPFGGCVPVQMASAAPPKAAGNATRARRSPKPYVKVASSNDDPALDPTFIADLIADGEELD